MQNILFFVHTEYHLLLSINQIVSIYSDKNQFDTRILVRANGFSRVRKDLDLTLLPCTIEYISEDFSIHKKLENEQIKLIQNIIESRPDMFIFFQELDPLMIILTNELSKRGTQISLFQDGMKPYVKLHLHSLGLIKNSIKTNRWLKENGYDSLGLYFLWDSKKYAYLKSISKVFLTFPESYDNWNRKELEKIEIMELPKLRLVLSKVFDFKDEYLSEKEKVIFYMNQPMHDDGKAEVHLLKELYKKYPDNKIFIKLHPLTQNADKIKLYEEIPNVSIIKSLIPAELFIMHLRNSIILSVNSTSMFINNPSCKFYYLNKIFEKEIKRLNRYRLSKPPSAHIRSVLSVNEILF